ncbi:MAG TPA: aldo/keto reductase [Opitutaceae bacterium]|jgi:aryl-alcohol dehydrogenase-like predicted oxidoreductase
MKFRKLGRTGLEVSEIGFGAWAIGGGWGPQSDADSVAALGRALDLGVNFIDTAAGYGDGRSERIIASVLRGRRDSVVVATKTPPSAGPWPPTPYCVASERYPAQYIRRNVEERLRNLGTDRIDILQLHTWTRAWNARPEAFEVLRALKEEGKVRFVGVSTPEQDQNAVIGLIRAGWVDVVQVIYNIFEQEPAAELLPAAAEHGVGVIVRVVFDEGSLTGKWTAETRFAEGDFRRNYFAGDRLARSVARAGRAADEVAGSGYTLPQAAIAFALAHPAVGTVIPGMRSPAQAEANCLVSSLAPMPGELQRRLRAHAWLRAFWYAGK